jgi:hypothetical protein
MCAAVRAEPTVTRSPVKIAREADRILWDEPMK